MEKENNKKKEKENFVEGKSEVLDVGLSEDSINIKPEKELTKEQKELVESIEWFHSKYRYYEPSDVANLSSVVPIAEMVNINFGILQELRKLNNLLEKKD